MGDASFELNVILCWRRGLDTAAIVEELHVLNVTKTQAEVANALARMLDRIRQNRARSA